MSATAVISLMSATAVISLPSAAFPAPVPLRLTFKLNNGIIETVVPAGESLKETMEKTVVYTMKSLPEEERPYEKCRCFGAAALTDAELLSVILRTGSVKDSALDLSKLILGQPDCKGLTGLYHLSYSQLTGIYGIGMVKAVQIQCLCEISRRIASAPHSSQTSFTCPGDVAEYFMERLRHEEQEHVLLVMLSNAGRLLGWERIALGTSCQAAVSPREIFQTALSYHAGSIILLHNHPGGDPTPSSEDVSLTRRLAESGELMGIELLDHIIIGDRIYFSFQEEQLI